MKQAFRIVSSVPLCLRGFCAMVMAAAPSAQQAPYYPPPGAWAKKAPAELGLDPVKLQEAIAFAQSRESNREMDFSDQERIFGTLLGSVPNIRAKTNGVVIYKGYVVAEFGDNDVGRSDLLGREEHAGDRGRHRHARRLDHESRRAGRRDRQGRRLRLAAQRAGHLEAPLAADRASGKATCGASRTTSSARKRSARAR